MFLKKYKYYFLIGSIIVMCIFTVSVVFQDNGKLGSDKREEVDFVDGVKVESDNKKLLQELLKGIDKETMSIWKLDEVENYDTSVDLKKYDNNFAIATISNEKNRSVVIAYEIKGDKYKFIGVIDSFYKVDDIQLLPLRSKNRPLVIIRETIDQSLGAFEQGTFIRAYFFDKEQFKLVLSLIEQYVAYYNQMWENNTELYPRARWLKTYQKSDIEWISEYYPEVNVLEHQYYYVSEGVNLVEKPKDSEFDVVKTQDVFTKYIWSEKWNHFIIGEGIEKKSGKEVGILENLTYDLFQLSKSEGTEEHTLRIKYKDGTIKNVPESAINFDKSNVPLKSVK